MSLWDEQYNAACAKLKEAEAQHKQANSIYCQAVERLDLARRDVVRLYQERIRFLNEPGRHAG